MAGESTIYRDLAYVFVAAVAGGAAARKLRQPLILGYVAAGVVVGPFTPGPRLSEVHVLELFAEVGVILLMYSIGIEFSIRDLMRVKWVALFGAPLGILFSIGLSLLVGQLLGWSAPQSIAIGAAVSVASTMVLSRLLIDSGELQAEHGRIMIGITLVEDFAVVALTVLLPSLRTLEGGELLAVGLSILKGILILTPIAVLSFKLVPPLMSWVSRTRNDELFLLVALALGFATAAFSEAVGLSLAVGAFLAGVVISGSEQAHDTLARVLPIRDAFVALFFVTIGALINPRILLSEPALLLELLALIIVGKFLIWLAVVRLFRYSLQTALLVAVGLTQIGEFSYVLIRVARDAQLVGDDVYNAMLATSLISILLNALLMRYARRTTAPAVPIAAAAK
ncbi:MAG TPA: cation:proton antiporter [Terriglobales bacterium]|jgi:CPA2 family monovalent cation:H+ antiporter-2